MLRFVTLFGIVTYGVALATEPAARRLGHTGHALDVADVGTTRVHIPAGWFTFGATDDERAAALDLCRRSLGTLEKVCTAELFQAEGPAREAFLPAYFIDRDEVTVAQYRRCVRAGRCDPRPLLDLDPRLAAPSLPVVRVAWYDAQDYCRFTGGELPTEEQWERAARGKAPRIFPWGDAPRDNNSNHGDFVVLDPTSAYARPVVRIDERDGFVFTAPPGSFPTGTSPDGLHDMSGNVAEWVADAIGDDGQRLGTAGALGARRMIRGGSYRQPLLYERTTAWDTAPPELRSPEIGFRCASERAAVPHDELE